MLMTYVRSSALGAFDLCQMSYFLQYNLNVPQKPNPRTSYGSIVHKCYELLALCKLAIQNGETEFDAEDFGILKVKDINRKHILNLSFNYYKKVEQPNFGGSDYNECKNRLDMALDTNGGMYDPMNLNILRAEQTFDFELPYDWAKYRYKLPNGQIIEGQLACKGTMDLVVKHDDDTIEYLDLKTGARIDWGTKEEKDYDYLMKDKQLWLYFIALVKAYPEYKNIIMSIYFCRDGGCFTLPYSKDDIPKAEQMLREYFAKIRFVEIPKLRRDDVCYKFCYFGKNKHPDSGKTLCKHYYDEVQSKGLLNTILEHGDVSRLSAYGSGGGRQAKETS